MLKLLVSASTLSLSSAAIGAAASAIVAGVGDDGPCDESFPLAPPRRGLIGNETPRRRLVAVPGDVTGRSYAPLCDDGRRIDVRRLATCMGGSCLNEFLQQCTFECMWYTDPPTMEPTSDDLVPSTIESTLGNNQDGPWQSPIAESTIINTTITPGFVCDVPTSGCANGMFNQALCECECIPPFCPDINGDCTDPSDNCGGNPWLQCTRGVNCPWWVNPLKAESCTTGPVVPLGLWTIFNTRVACCNANFPYSEFCDPTPTSGGPTKHPTVAAPEALEDDIYEVILIKFHVSGLPDAAPMRAVKDEMNTVLKRILLRLADQIEGLRISSVEEKVVFDRNRLRALRKDVTLYFNVYVVRDDDKKFGPLIVQELGDSYEEVLGQIRTFADLQYLGGEDLNFNWCTPQNGSFSLCAKETADDPMRPGVSVPGLRPDAPTIQPTTTPEPTISISPIVEAAIVPGPGFICDLPTSGCTNGMFNQALCECQCIPPFCPDTNGDCMDPSDNCGGNPWLQCARGVNCPWWVNPLKAESCTTGPVVPVGLWQIYNTQKACCNTNFAYSNICDFSASAPTERPTVASIAADDALEVIPIKFDAGGLPADFDMRELKDEMGTVLKRILLRLARSIPGLRITNVEELVAIGNAVEETVHAVQLSLENVPAGYSISRTNRASILRFVRGLLEDNLNDSFQLIDIAYASNDRHRSLLSPRIQKRRRLETVSLPLNVTVRGALDVSNFASSSVMDALGNTKSALANFLKSIDWNTFKNVTVSYGAMPSTRNLRITLTPWRVLTENVALYYNVYAVRDDDKKFGPMIIQALRDSYDEIIQEIKTYMDTKYLGREGLDLNWCTLQNGEFSLCVKETVDITSPTGVPVPGLEIVEPTLPPTVTTEPTSSISEELTPSMARTVPPSLGIVCVAPMGGCTNGMFNQTKCKCECIQPYCPHTDGRCTMNSNNCGGNPWAECTRGANCPWWVDALQAESCTSGPDIPVNVWEIYNTKKACCNGNFPNSDVCVVETVASAPTEFPTITSSPSMGLVMEEVSTIKPTNTLEPTSAPSKVPSVAKSSSGPSNKNPTVAPTDSNEPTVPTTSREPSEKPTPAPSNSTRTTAPIKEPSRKPTLAPIKIDMEGDTYYPNFSNGLCLNDGNFPPGVSEQYLFQNATKCCDTYFPTNMEACVLARVPTASPTALAEKVWYPDYENDICKNDGQQGSFEINFFSTYEKCCEFDLVHTDKCLESLNLDGEESVDDDNVRVSGSDASKSASNFMFLIVQSLSMLFFSF